MSESEVPLVAITADNGAGQTTICRELVTVPVLVSLFRNGVQALAVGFCIYKLTCLPCHEFFFGICCQDCPHQPLPQLPVEP